MCSTNCLEPEVSSLISLLSKASLNYNFTATYNTHQLEIISFILTYSFNFYFYSPILILTTCQLSYYNNYLTSHSRLMSLPSSIKYNSDHVTFLPQNLYCFVIAKIKTQICLATLSISAIRLLLPPACPYFLSLQLEVLFPFSFIHTTAHLLRLPT